MASWRAQDSFPPCRSATRSLHSAEAAHKHTTAELQRTRTALQALRIAHQTEIKKLEKEKDRMAERWSKLADSQLKAGSLSSGLTCANAIVVEASDMQLRGVGRNFLEDAAEQAEQAREALFEQNRRLRGLILTTANELQSMQNSRLPEGREEVRRACSATCSFIQLLTADTAYHDHPVCCFSC